VKLSNSYPPSTKGKIIVWGQMAALPFGGMIWQVLHHLAGFRRLGFDVYYVEDSDRPLFDPITYNPSWDCKPNVALLSRYMEGAGFGDRWVFRPPEVYDTCYGAADCNGLKALYREAAAVFNLCGSQELREEHARIRCRVYLETDPVLTQVAVAKGEKRIIDELDAYHFFFTYGANLGASDCPVPIQRYDWIPTRPPVCIDWWASGAPPSPGSSLTTIANWKHKGKDTVWQGETWHKWDNLVLLDYDHPNEKTRKDLWDYMCGYGLFWAEFAARTKGMIRLDNLHSSHHGFMRHVLAEIRKAYPDITIFAELFTDTTKSSDLVWTYGLDLMLATPWEHHFVPQLRAYLGEVHRRDAQTPHMLPITSHDSGTPAEEFGSVESTVPRYAVSALMGCGATGLVQGVEYGLPRKIPLVGIKPPPDYNTGRDYTPLISKINEILVENYVFQTGGNITFIDDGHDAIIAAYRFDTSKKATEFVVLCNFDIFNKQEISIDLNRHMPETAVQSFTDILGGSILTPANGRLNVTMEPCSALVLKIIQ